MSRWVLLAAVVAVACAAAQGAEVGQLTPGACDPPRAPFSLWFYSQDQGNRPDGAKGLVHPKAVWFNCQSHPATTQRLIVAIDATDPQAEEPNLVRLKAVEGPILAADFTDAVTAKLQPKPDKTNEWWVPKEEVSMVQVAGRQVPARIDLTYSREGGNRSLRIKYGTCLAGVCQFGPSAYPVQIRDANLNFSCQDRVEPVRDGKEIKPGDAVYIDTGDGSFTGQKVILAALGQPVWLDGAWYDVQVSDDAAGVTAGLLDLPAGWIRIPNGQSELIALSGKHVMFFDCLQDGAELAMPAGDYVVARFKQFVEFPVQAKGAILVEPGSTFMTTPANRRFTVEAGQVTDVAMGEPVKALLSVTGQASQLVFQAKIVDAGGTPAQFVGGGRPPGVKLTIKDAEGTVIHSANMEFG